MSMKYLKKFEQAYWGDIFTTNRDIKISLQALIDDGFEYELIDSANFPSGKHTLTLDINGTHIPHDIPSEINKCLRKVKSIYDKRIIISVVLEYTVTRADNKTYVTGGYEHLYYDNLLPDTLDGEVENMLFNIEQEVIKSYIPMFPVEVKVSILGIRINID